MKIIIVLAFSYQSTQLYQNDYRELYKSLAFCYLVERSLSVRGFKKLRTTDKMYKCVC